MKRIGYNSLALLATLVFVGVASTAMATPNPNGIYAPPTFVRFFNDYPQATVTLTNNYPASVVWSMDVPFALTGWANKGVWELSGDGGATHLLFANLSNYSFEGDFSIDGTSIGHAEGGFEVSPWWNDDGGEIMVRLPDGYVQWWGTTMPTYTNGGFDFTAAFGIHYTQGQVVHQKVRYLAGASEPSALNPATVEVSLILAGTPYTSGVLTCGPRNPSDPPHGDYGQLDDTKLGGQIMGGPIMGGTGAGTVVGTFGNINFQNLDQPTPTHSSTWGAMKALYR